MILTGPIANCCCKASLKGLLNMALSLSGLPLIEIIYLDPINFQSHVVTVCSYLCELLLCLIYDLRLVMVIFKIDFRAIDDTFKYHEDNLYIKSWIEKNVDLFVTFNVLDFDFVASENLFQKLKIELKLAWLKQSYYWQNKALRVEQTSHKFHIPRIVILVLRVWIFGKNNDLVNNIKVANVKYRLKKEVPLQDFILRILSQTKVSDHNHYDYCKNNSSNDEERYYPL